jgi:hypothetical protein
MHFLSAFLITVYLGAKISYAVHCHISLILKSIFLQSDGIGILFQMVVYW